MPDIGMYRRTLPAPHRVSRTMHLMKTLVVLTAVSLTACTPETLSLIHISEPTRPY